MSIVLEQLTKRYDGYPVVNNVSLEVKDSEFFVLLGSSGSGKSTILNLIAGLTEADHGQIILHNRNVTYLPTQKRRVGLVFQSYALFQYMTVAENVEFGLSIQKVAPAERRKRRDEALELVGLSGLGGRMPRQLSGGQQQRVALARALVYGPEVLLLDEPLGALDARVRVDLRRSLKAIQRTLGITTIFVTHDQEEAFDLADRIGVMSFGRLVEVGTPEALYQRPQTEFVASFLGSANLLVGNITSQNVELGPIRLPIPPEIGLAGRERRVQVLFRPEDVALAPTREELACPELGRAEVEEVSFGGAHERLRLRLPPIAGVRPISPLPGFGSASVLVDATRSPEQASRFPLHPGENAWVGVHRFHALVHPGLSFLIVTDGSLRAQAALALGGQIARLAHARVTLLGVGPNGPAMDDHLQEARKQLGSGLAALEVQTSNVPIPLAVSNAAEGAPYDLVIMGLSFQENLLLAEQVLQAGDFHLLLVPHHQPAPTQTLICATSGEPGKEDVLFAGRLVRHLGAEAALLCVLSGGEKNTEKVEQTQRFLDGGVQSLSILGVPARTIVRTGPIVQEILNEVKGYDLLVMGAPLAHQRREIKLDGVVGQVLTALTDQAVLIVRSHLIQSKNPLAQPGVMAK